MSVHFRPDMKPYKNLGSFRMWCQKVLPAVYDESLSYYEVLCKLKDYLNSVIENVDGLYEDMDALYNAYGLLEDYVNGYFDNLDVQAEINNKLDDMARDGSLSALIAPFVEALLPDEVASRISAVVESQLPAVVRIQLPPELANQLPAEVAQQIPDLVTAWLNLHVVQPVEVIIDDSLTIRGAAADAKTVGDVISELKSALTQNTSDIADLQRINYTTDYVDSEVEIVTGEMPNTSGKIITWTNAKRTKLYPVEAGHKYKINGRGLAQYVALACYNTNVDADANENTCVSTYGDGTVTNYIYTADANVKGIIVGLSQYSLGGTLSLYYEDFITPILPEVVEKTANVPYDEFNIKNLERRMLNAEHNNDFKWSAFDKPYFVFIHDDLNEYTGDFATVFHNKNVPMCEAAIPSVITPEKKTVMESIVADSGEILAHYSASPTEESSDALWLQCTRDVKMALESEGFDIYGIIRAGSTGYMTNKGEKYCRLYFDYANEGMGKSVQFNLPRAGLWNFASIDDAKTRILAECSVNGIHAYGFHGKSPDAAWVTPENIGVLIDYIVANGGEIVTYKYLYDNFGSSVLAEKIKELE